MTDTKDKKREKLGILCCTAGATSWGLSGTCSEALFSQYPVDNDMGDGGENDISGDHIAGFLRLRSTV